MLLSKGSIFRSRFQVTRSFNAGTHVARDTLIPARKVLIKQSLSGTADAFFLQREAKAYQITWMANSSNPKLIAKSSKDEFQQFLVRDYKEGLTVSSIGTVTLSTLITLMHSALRTLESYERCGMLHADVKPDNMVFDENKPNSSGIMIDPMGFQFSPGGTVYPEVCGGTRDFAPQEERDSGMVPGMTRDVFGAGKVFLLMLRSLPFLITEDPVVTNLLNICKKATHRFPEIRYRRISELRQDLDRAIEAIDFDFFTDHKLTYLMRP